MNFLLFVHTKGVICVIIYAHFILTSMSEVKNKQEKYRENGNGLFGNAYL